MEVACDPHDGAGIQWILSLRRPSSTRSTRKRPNAKRTVFHDVTHESQHKNTKGSSTSTNIQMQDKLTDEEEQRIALVCDQIQREAENIIQRKLAKFSLLLKKKTEFMVKEVTRKSPSCTCHDLEEKTCSLNPSGSACYKKNVTFTTSRRDGLTTASRSGGREKVSAKPKNTVSDNIGNTHMNMSGKPTVPRSSLLPVNRYTKTKLDKERRKDERRGEISSQKRARNLQQEQLTRGALHDMILKDRLLYQSVKKQLREHDYPDKFSVEVCF